MHTDVNENDAIHVLSGKSVREVLEAAAIKGPTGKQAELCSKIRGCGQEPENGAIHYMLGNADSEDLEAVALPGSVGKIR